MVGIVVVSHSQRLAEGAVELAKMMAHEAKIAPAGGLEDGSAGTSFEKISAAVEEVYSDDGVAILMDMGSAVMTAEMVIEAMDDKKIIMLDGPVVEGTIVASLEAMMGTPLEELQAKVEESRYTKKLEG
ncbi:MAG: PTS-dependent dihydroxyacetone kinase phosphotransferase subunit DhaM [Selenomonadales bacterium]|nr:PTS-dependent dihydroxyacetone kinase phosphotransferase subunit DhaM [Selenomonadales bacterium]